MNSPPSGSWSQVAAGAAHHSAISTDGAVDGWENNSRGPASIP